MTRTRYLAVRSLQTVFLLWLVLTFLFFFFRLMPGRFSDIMMMGGVSPEQAELIREKWGLNDPLYIQYWEYITNFVTGDVGTSLRLRQPVWDLVKPRIFNSFILVAPGITIGYLIGAVTGTLLGDKRGTNFERSGIIAAVFVGTIPIFFFAILMIIIFSGWLNWLPSSGIISQGNIGDYQGAWWEMYLTTDFLLHYILPVSVVTLRYSGLPTLIMRTSVVEVIGQDFIQYHRITGIPRRDRLVQVAKHASLPLLTVYPISMTRAVGGLVLLEVVFNWPGIGYTLVESVFMRDFPVLQFVFFLVAAFVIISNFVIDLLYGVIDPRVSIE